MSAVPAVARHGNARDVIDVALAHHILKLVEALNLAPATGRLLGICSAADSRRMLRFNKANKANKADKDFPPEFF